MEAVGPELTRLQWVPGCILEAGAAPEGVLKTEESQNPSSESLSAGSGHRLRPRGVWSCPGEPWGHVSPSAEEVQGSSVGHQAWGLE